MASSTVLLNIPNTYDLNGIWNGFEVYAIDCTSGDITLSMQQAFASGLYYQVIRVDNSTNNLIVNAYSGDTINGSLTTINFPPNTMAWCQTVANGNWLIPKQSFSWN